jgi:hypothetical protein
VQYDGETGKTLLDLVQDVECQWRRNQLTCLGIACALLGSELVSTVAGTDRDSQRVATRTLAEVLYLFGLCVVRYLAGNLILYTCQNAELSLYGYIVSVSILYNLLCQSDVLLVRKRRTVDHYARETIVDTVLAEFEAITVIQVKNDLRISATQLLSILNSTLSHVTEDSTVSIVTSTLRYLHDNGRLGLYCCLYDSLHLLQSIEVECGDSVATCYCLGKHFTGVYQTQFLVTCHRILNLVIFEFSI